MTGRGPAHSYNSALTYPCQPAGGEIQRGGVSSYLKAYRRVVEPFTVRQAHHERLQRHIRHTIRGTSATTPTRISAPPAPSAVSPSVIPTLAMSRAPTDMRTSHRPPTQYFLLSQPSAISAPSAVSLPRSNTSLLETEDIVPLPSEDHGSKAMKRSLPLRRAACCSA